MAGTDMHHSAEEAKDLSSSVYQVLVLWELDFQPHLIKFGFWITFLAYKNQLNISFKQEIVQLIFLINT